MTIKLSISVLKKNMKFIPVNEPVISIQAKENVRAALKSGWLSSAGPFVAKFEEEFASYVGMKYGVAVSSGTAALHVALLGLGINEGDEVIVPAFTMAATWMAVLYVGARPVFVDCDRQSYNLDIDQIEKKITPRTRAIIPVHIYGEPVNMTPLLKIAARHNLEVIEDAAEAHGATYRKQKCGFFGKVGCFSFYANKLITCGEGGMLVTNDPILANEFRRYRDLYHGEKRFIHPKLGYNYRLTNLQAAVGLGELRNIDAYFERKQQMAQIYYNQLSGIPGIKFQAHSSKSRCSFWMMALTIDKEKFGCSRDQLREKLKVRGIDSRDFFYSPHQQPVLKKFLLPTEKFPNTEMLSETGLYLPSGLALTQRQILTVCRTIKKIYIENS